MYLCVKYSYMKQCMHSCLNKAIMILNIYCNIVFYEIPTFLVFLYLILFDLVLLLFNSFELHY